MLNILELKKYDLCKLIKIFLTQKTFLKHKLYQSVSLIWTFWKKNSDGLMKNIFSRKIAEKYTLLEI